MEFQIFDTSIYSGYHIYLKKNKTNINLETILKLLGIEFSTPVIDKDEILNYDYMSGRICISEINDWIQIIDDPYFLYNIHNFLLVEKGRDIIKELSKKFSEVFIIGDFGEMNDVYLFKYYKNAIRERDVYIESMSAEDTTIKCFGKPLTGEPKILHFGKIKEASVSITVNLGLDIKFDISDGKFYIFDNNYYHKLD